MAGPLAVLLVLRREEQQQGGKGGGEGEEEEVEAAWMRVLGVEVSGTVVRACVCVMQGVLFLSLSG